MRFDAVNRTNRLCRERQIDPGSESCHLSEKGDKRAVTGKFERAGDDRNALFLCQQFDGFKKTPLLPPLLITQSCFSPKNAANGLLTCPHPGG